MADITLTLTVKDDGTVQLKKFGKNLQTFNRQAKKDTKQTTDEMTSGWQKMRNKMDKLLGTRFASMLSNSFSAFGKVAKQLFGEMKTGLKVLTPIIGGLMSAFKALIAVTLAWQVVVITTAALTTTGLVKVGKGILTLTEQFEKYRIVLKGALKDTTAVNKILKFAQDFAITAPTTFRAIVDAVKGFAIIPQLKPMLLDMDNLNKTLRKLMNTALGLMSLAPEQGMQGALFALREALSGQFRSLQFRFNLMPEVVAGAIGKTVQELKRSPKVFLEAISTFIEQNIGAATLEAMGKQLSIQLGNITDAFEKAAILIGRSGFYQAVVEQVIRVVEALSKWVDSADFVDNQSVRISNAFSSMVDSITMSAQSLISVLIESFFPTLDKLFGGDKLLTVSEAFTRLVEMFAEQLDKLPVWVDKNSKSILGFLGDAKVVLEAISKLTVGIATAGVKVGAFLVKISKPLIVRKRAETEDVVSSLRELKDPEVGFEETAKSLLKAAHASGFWSAEMEKGLVFLKEVLELNRKLSNQSSGVEGLGKKVTAVLENLRGQTEDAQQSEKEWTAVFLNQHRIRLSLFNQALGMVKKLELRFLTTFDPEKGAVKKFEQQTSTIQTAWNDYVRQREDDIAAGGDKFTKAQKEALEAELVEQTRLWKIGFGKFTRMVELLTEQARLKARRAQVKFVQEVIGGLGGEGGSTRLQLEAFEQLKMSQRKQLVSERKILEFRLKSLGMTAEKAREVSMLRIHLMGVEFTKQNEFLQLQIQAQNNFLAATELGYQNYFSKLKNQYQLVTEFAETSFGRIAQTFEDVVVEGVVLGTRKIGDIFRQTILDIEISFLKMLTKIILKKAMVGLFGFDPIQAGINALSGAITPTAAAGIGTNIAQGITQFAVPGGIQLPQGFVNVGSAGASFESFDTGLNHPSFHTGTPRTSKGLVNVDDDEAIIPLPDGRSVPVSLGGSQQGGDIVIMNVIDAEDITAAGLSTNGNQRVVKNIINSDTLRRGSTRRIRKSFDD